MSKKGVQNVIFKRICDKSEYRLCTFLIPEDDLAQQLWFLLEIDSSLKRCADSTYKLYVSSLITKDINQDFTFFVV